MVENDAEAKTEVEQKKDGPAETIEETAETDTSTVEGNSAPAPAAEETPAKIEESAEDLEGKIIRQLEYYFGDANIVRDKFLRAQIEDAEGGWVTLDVLLTFKRLAALTTDKKVIAEAIAKSDAGLIEVSEDGQKLRRYPEHPLPEANEEYRKEMMSRTAYVKGFPLEADMSDLINFFSSHDKVVNVTMRKYLHKPSKTHKFKGSVFVTFATAEQAKAFVDQETIEYNERPLLRKMQGDYLDEKHAEIQKKKAKKEKEQEELEAFKLPTGTVIAFAKGGEGLTRELIRKAIVNVDETAVVAFIDYNKGDTEGRVRFDKENSAKEFLEKLADKQLEVTDEIKLELTLLEGDDEKAFLDKASEDMRNRRRASRTGRKRRGGGGNFYRNENKKAKAD